MEVPGLKRAFRHTLDQLRQRAALLAARLHPAHAGRLLVLGADDLARLALEIRDPRDMRAKDRAVNRYNRLRPSPTLKIEV